MTDVATIRSHYTLHTQLILQTLHRTVLYCTVLYYCTGAALVPPVQHQGGGLHLPHPQGGQHHLAGLHGRSRWDIMNKNIFMCLKIFAENINMSRRGDVQGHRLPRPPQGAGLQTAWNSEENLSIVIVRHPYSRLGWLISVVCILKIIRHFSFSQCVLQ